MKLSDGQNNDLSKRDARIFKIGVIVAGGVLAVIAASILTATAHIVVHTDLQERPVWNGSSDSVPFRIVGYDHIQSVQVAKEVADYVTEACVTTDYWLLPDKYQCYPMERIDESDGGSR